MARLVLSKKEHSTRKCHLKQSVIPEQGQFHMSLNALQNIVIIFKYFVNFITLYLDRIFQTSQEHTKWQHVKLLPFPGGFKSATESYKSLAFVKNTNLCQLSTYLNMCCHHSFSIQCFRSRDHLEYENVMTQMAVLFICWARRQYNKLTFSFLSDMEYQKVFLPGYWLKKLEYICLITEKKVETFNSILREHTTKHDDVMALPWMGFSQTMLETLTVCVCIFGPEFVVLCQC